MNLQQKYQKVVIPAMKAAFDLKNDLAVPKVIKVVLNIGIGKAKDDPKIAELAEHTLSRITGQKPVYTLAKKSISAFKIRQDMKVGLKVTLRGKRMWDFLNKLVAVALPRVRDFRGLDPKIIDRHGNLSIGFKEHMVFPEIKSDEIEKIHGLEITVVTDAMTYQEGLSLFKNLGFPFKQV